MTPYYEQDGVTIYHGDCREILPALADSPALVIADPPYGIALETDYEKSYGFETRLGAERKRHPKVHGDDQPYDPTPLLQYDRLFLFGANYYRASLPAGGGWLCWDKVCSNEVKRLPGWSDGELAWTNTFKGVRIFRHAWNGFSRASENSFHVHPTQKPVALMGWVIGRHTEPGDLILDPFMGSGPTMRAARDLGRRAIGIEIEESYCAIAAERLAQQTLDLGAAA